MDAVGVRIDGQGNAEQEWERSAWLEALPEIAPDAVLQDTRRLVVVSPHPDDEVLGCGGLMQAAIALDISVCVVSVTDGEACYPGQPHWPPARLRDSRRRELATAMQALGLDATHVRSLGMPDGEVIHREQALAADLAANLSPGDLLVAPWVHDAHPDHEATGRAAVRAAETRRDVRVLQYPVWAWHWLDPHAAERPWVSARRVRMDARAQARKQEAMQAFATQTGAVEGLGCDPVLPAHVIARFKRSYEVLIG